MTRDIELSNTSRLLQIALMLQSWPSWLNLSTCRKYLHVYPVSNDTVRTTPKTTEYLVGIHFWNYEILTDMNPLSQSDEVKNDRQ